MLISKSVRVLGNDYFRLYLAGSDPMILIEGGVSGIIPLVKQQLKDMQVNGPKVSRLVVMHAHFDHVCGVPGLCAILKNPETWASARAAAILARPNILAGFFSQDCAMTENIGQSPGIVPLGMPPEKIDIQNIIIDGTVWRLGKGISLRFMSAPGHSPCSITAYCPEEEILFCSDSAGFPVDNNTIFPIFFDGFSNYVQTVKKMAEMPVSVLAGAHGEIIFGRRQVKEHLQRALHWAEKTRDLVLEEQRRGADREELSRIIFEMFFRGRLEIYTRDNIMLCSELIVRRSIESKEK